MPAPVSPAAVQISISGTKGATTESGTIRIGNSLQHARAFIAGIRGATTGQNNAIPVLIDSTGQLGTMSSSRRYKKEIKPMDKASEAILALKPVTFHYKSDSTNKPEFGLIAEEVAEVNPDFVVRDENGEIYTVRYDAVNAMLLNEFLKEQATVQELKKEIAALTARLNQQESKIDKVSAPVEMSGPSTRVAARQR
jgi:Chaperone of endosialidase